MSCLLEYYIVQDVVCLQDELFYHCTSGILLLLTRGPLYGLLSAPFLLRIFCTLLLCRICLSSFSIHLRCIRGYINISVEIFIGYLRLLFLIGIRKDNLEC